MPRISAKNQVTLPTRVLEEAGLAAGEEVVVEPTAAGELRIRRCALSFEDALGALSGVYPEDYLGRLDAEEEERG